MRTRRASLILFVCVAVVLGVPAPRYGVGAQVDDVLLEGSIDLSPLAAGDEITNGVRLVIPTGGGSVSGQVVFRLERVRFDTGIVDSEAEYPDCQMTWALQGEVISGLYTPGMQIDGTMQITLQVADVIACDPAWEANERVFVTAWRGTYDPDRRSLAGSFDVSEGSPLGFEAFEVEASTTTTTSTTEPVASTDPEPTTETSLDGSGASTFEDEISVISITHTIRDCANEDAVFGLFVLETPTRVLDGDGRQPPMPWRIKPGDIVSVPGRFVLSLEGRTGHMFIRGPCVFAAPCTDPSDDRPVSTFEFLQGIGFFSFDDPSNIHTPYIEAGVLGTEFILDVDGSSTLVFVIEGSVLVTGHDMGQQVVDAGFWIEGTSALETEPQLMTPGQLEAAYPWVNGLAERESGLWPQPTNLVQDPETGDAAVGEGDDHGPDMMIIISLGLAAVLALVVALALIRRRRPTSSTDLGIPGALESPPPIPPSPIDPPPP